jgi:hypothetical protein
VSDISGCSLCAQCVREAEAWADVAAEWRKVARQHYEREAKAIGLLRAMRDALEVDEKGWAKLDPFADFETTLEAVDTLLGSAGASG